MITSTVQTKPVKHSVLLEELKSNPFLNWKWSIFDLVLAAIIAFYVL